MIGVPNCSNGSFSSNLSEDINRSMRFTRLRDGSSTNHHVQTRRPSAVDNPNGGNEFNFAFPDSAWSKGGNLKEIQSRRLSRQRNKSEVKRTGGLSSRERDADLVAEEMDEADSKENHFSQENSEESSTAGSACLPESPKFLRMVKETTPSADLSQEISEQNCSMNSMENLSMGSVARKHCLFSEIRRQQYSTACPRMEGNVLVADTPEVDYSVRVSLRQRRHLLPPNAAERLLMNF